MITAILLTIAPLTGCGSTSTAIHVPAQSFSGRRFTTFTNGSETLTVNADGTYQQLLVANNHARLVTVGRWSMGTAPAKSAYTGPYLILYAYATPWEWLAHPGTKADRTSTLMSTDGFNGVSTLRTGIPLLDNQKRKLPVAASGTIIALSLLFTVVWVLAIVNAAQRGQIGWLVMIVLFPCCVTPFYAIFGMLGGGGARRY